MLFAVANRPNSSFAPSSLGVPSVENADTNLCKDICSTVVFGVNGDENRVANQFVRNGVTTN